MQGWLLTRYSPVRHSHRVLNTQRPSFCMCYSLGKACCSSFGSYMPLLPNYPSTINLGRSVIPFLSHDAVGYLFHRLFALSAEHADPVRLACVRRAASVRPEPGSNPQTKYLSVCPGDESHSSARTYILCVFRLLVLAKQLNYSRRPWIHRNP